MKFIVFDLDGTLVNTIFDIAYSMNMSLEEHGFKTHPVESYLTFIGEGVVVLTKKAIGNEVSDEIVQSVLDRYNEIYKNHCMVLSEVYPNMIEVLDELIAKGYKLAVISNKPDFDTQMIVRHYFNNRFTYIAGSKPLVARKPSREAMDIFMKTFDISVEEIVYVGDSQFDAMFAENSGCRYFLFEYGYSAKELIYKHKPVAFLNEANELLKYF